ncbi:hypothetical protein HQ585_09660 [candidate division KSB1 bacterium]|nr:hypothetical protein [candidate division KSB1 bacterium]
MIPQFNDSPENINSIIAFLKEVGGTEINILPLHHLGHEKYKSLNREYIGLNYLIPNTENLLKVRQIFTEESINCYLGGETPF